MRVRVRGAGSGDRLDRAARKAAALIAMHARARVEETRQTMGARWAALQLASVNAELDRHPLRHPTRVALQRERERLRQREAECLDLAAEARRVRVGSLQELGRVARDEDSAVVDPPADAAAADADDDD